MMIVYYTMGAGHHRGKQDKFFLEQSTGARAYSSSCIYGFTGKENCVYFLWVTTLVAHHEHDLHGTHTHIYIERERDTHTCPDHLYSIAYDKSFCYWVRDLNGVVAVGEESSTTIY
jgi:hypothetical protein